MDIQWNQAGSVWTRLNAQGQTEIYDRSIRMGVSADSPERALERMKICVRMKITFDKERKLLR